MIKRKRLLRLLIMNCFILILFLLQSRFLMWGTTYSYNLNFQGYSYQDFSGYFPADTPSPGGYTYNHSQALNGISNLKIRSYPVPVTYSMHTGGLSGWSPYEENAPTITIYTCDKNGNNCVKVAGISSHNSSGSGGFTIPANQGMYITAHVGCSRGWFNFTGDIPCFIDNLSYKIDSVKPLKPAGLKITEVQNDGGVYSANGITYTKNNPVKLQWDQGTDQGDPCSGVEGYNLYYNSNTYICTQTGYDDTINQLFAADGQYTAQLRVKDKEGLLSDPSSFTFVVDRTVSPVTAPSHPVQLSRQPDGTYDVNVAWNQVQDVSGIKKYQLNLTSSPTVPETGWVDVSAQSPEPNQYQYTFPNQPVSDTRLYLYIRAVDNLNNIGQWIRIPNPESYNFSFFDNANQDFFMYLPSAKISPGISSYSSGQTLYINGLADLCTRRCPIPITYNMRCGGMGGWLPGQENIPTISIQTCSIDGNITSLIHHIEGQQSNASGYFELEANQGIYITAHTGTWRDFLGTVGPIWCFVDIDLPGFFKIWSPIVSVHAIPKASIVNNRIAYSVELQLEDNLEAAKYIIEREGPTLVSPVVLTYQQLKDNGFQYIDSDNLVKHGQYRYSVYTENEYGVASEKTVTPDIVIPNIEPNSSISGPRPIVVFTDVTFALGKMMDSEDDNLEYRLYTRVPGMETGTLVQSWIPTVDNQKVTVSFPDKTTLEWKMCCIESNSDIPDRVEVSLAGWNQLYIDTRYPLPHCFNAFGENLWGTKGQELRFEVETNPVAHFADFVWNFGDGGATAGGAETSHTYCSLSEPDVPYIVTVTATDDTGVQYTGTIKIHIVNTSKGRLYADETWSGTHTITEDVGVPAGIKLTIEPGTVVQVNPECYLRVSGQMEAIDPGKGIRFAGESLASTWQGIRFDDAGTGTLDGVTVSRAIRGVACTGSGSVTLKNDIFSQNDIGLHCYGGVITVDNCIFLENPVYGIKEDHGCNPLIKNCIFQSNGIHYYDQNLYEIPLDKLNTSPNEGNEYR